jgi:hypothetical protein
MSFRKPQTVITRQPGQYVGGRWVDGNENPPTTIMASIQPATASDYDQMQAEPGGRRIECMVRVYTAARLDVAGEANSNGAVLLWEGERYLFVAVSPWRSTALAHYRYLAALETPDGST